jgi:hypothetical protein
MSSAGLTYDGDGAHVFVLKVLEQLELTVCALGEHGCAERLHDFLDGDILVGELISSRANETKSSHTNGLEIGVSARKGQYGDERAGSRTLKTCQTYLEVISNVVPKI